MTEEGYLRLKQRSKTVMDARDLRDLFSYVDRLISERDFFRNSRSEHIELHLRSIDMKETYLKEIKRQTKILAEIQTRLDRLLKCIE